VKFLVNVLSLQFHIGSPSVASLNSLFTIAVSLLDILKILGSEPFAGLLM
jgi:hypothetical protein